MFSNARGMTFDRLGPCLILCALAGCAGQGVTHTGFLSSYDGMRPTKSHTEDLIFVDPSYAREHYTSIYIEPIAWVPAPDAPPRDPQVATALEADFHKSLSEKLSKNFQILEAQPGQSTPGVLRVRAAITNTRQAHWWINAPVDLAGVGLAVVGLPGGIPSPDPGGASEELEALDGTTGKRLVALATFNNGMPWNKIGDFKRFGHAHRAFRIAADLLYEQLTTQAHELGGVAAANGGRQTP